MKSVYGYIKPPYKVNDFVPIVYREGNNSFVAEIRNYKIVDFIPIDEHDYEIQPITWIEQKVHIDSPALYGFLNDMDVLQPDWADTLFDVYVKFLRKSRLNIYARLSIVNVLELTGLKYKLIGKINKAYNIHEYKYTYPSVDQDSFATYTANNRQEVADIIYMQNQVLSRFHHLITWNDLIYIWKDHIYIGKFKIKSQDFKNDFAEAKSILLDYCSPLALSEQLAVINSNRETYKDWLPGAGEALPDTEQHEILKDYYLEKQSAERMQEYGQRLTEVKLKHFANQFNSILAFCNAD